MFPLTSNEAYIKSTGERSTLGKMLEEGGNEPIEEKLNKEIATRAELGAHNLLPLKAGTKTDKGVTFTTTSDGVTTISGTASEWVSWEESADERTLTHLAAGSYIVTLGATLPANTYFTVKNSSGTAICNINPGQNKNTFTLESAADVYGYVGTNSTTLLDVTIYPMIRVASDADTNFQPYAMTNRELTEKRVKYAEASGTLSDTLYNGYYYADVAITLPTNAVLISALVTVSNYNNFCTAQVLSATTLRVFGNTSGNTFTVRYAYI